MRMISSCQLRMDSARFILVSAPVIVDGLARFHMGLDHGIQRWRGVFIARINVSADGPGIRMEDVFTDAAGFAYQHGARSNVPRCQPHFPVAIVATTSHPRKVKRSRSVPPHTAGASNG